MRTLFEISKLQRKCKHVQYALFGQISYILLVVLLNSWALYAFCVCEIPYIRVYLGIIVSITEVKGV